MESGVLVRIAVSGSHGVGKTTLAEVLVESLPGYDLVPEPYYLLEQEGYAFSDPPTLPDFEAQLECSLGLVEESGPDVVIDRCPLDFLGYLDTHPDAASFRIEEWFPRIEAAIRLIALVVFVPVEKPDRVAVPPEDIRLRTRVNAALKDIILDDAHGLGFEVIPVAGPVAERRDRVLAVLV